MKVIFFGIGSPIVVEYVETCRRLGWAIVAAIKNRSDDAHFEDQTKILTVGTITSELMACSCWCPMFTPANRAQATREAKALGFQFEQALVDPTAITCATSHVGGGSFVNAGCIIGASGSISRHVLINRGAVIGHHVKIGDYVSIGPGAIVGGLAMMERGAMIGTGAILLPKVKIGEFAVVGAGALVTRDVPPGTKVIGNPARVIESNLPEFEMSDIVS